jgi:hypothetical protein
MLKRTPDELPMQRMKFPFCAFIGVLLQNLPFIVTNFYLHMDISKLNLAPQNPETSGDKRPSFFYSYRLDDGSTYTRV